MTAALLALALAHESGVSSSRLEMRGGQVCATFTFSLEDLAGLARLDADRNGLIEPAEWARVLPPIAAYVGDHFRIEGCRSEGVPERTPAAVRSSEPRTPITLTLRYVPAQPLERLKIRCDLFREHGGNPRHIAEFPDGGTVVFDNDRRDGDRPLSRSPLRWPWIAAGILAVLFLVMGPAAHRPILRPHERTIDGPGPAFPDIHGPHPRPGAPPGGPGGGDPDSAAQLPRLGA